MNYMHRQKISLAQMLLKDRKLSVSEISDRVGFSSPSYFCAVFKKHTGTSPAAYQQSEGEHPINSRFQSFGNADK